MDRVKELTRLLEQMAERSAAEGESKQDWLSALQDMADELNGWVMMVEDEIRVEQEEEEPEEDSHHA
jgi:hypothetical protein